jgi:hypothetical protein
MTHRALVAAAAIVATTAVASAHGPKIGVNGGPQADAGSYHVEALGQGTILQIWLRDHSNKPVSSVGYKGTAIFMIGGKPQRIPLAPAGDNKLTGRSEVQIPAALKGAVQITTPTGSTVQAKFE